MFGVEHRAVLDELYADETRQPVPFKQRADRRIYCSRNFGGIRRAPGRPKISDFGLAVRDKGEPHYHGIQPDLLRAPEVLLEAGWSCSVDIWSLGVMVRMSFFAELKRV